MNIPLLHKLAGTDNSQPDPQPNHYPSIHSTPNWLRKLAGIDN